MPEPFTPTLAKSASLATLAGTTHTRKSVSFVQSSTARKARHPNQLDLFADTPIDRASAADSLTAPALATEHPDGRQYPLAQMIHSHWLKHQPQMVEELTQKNLLSQALHQARSGRQISSTNSSR